MPHTQTQNQEYTHTTNNHMIIIKTPNKDMSPTYPTIAKTPRKHMAPTLSTIDKTSKHHKTKKTQ